MFGFLVEEIRLCAEGATPEIHSKNKTARKQARLKAWADAKGISHPKSLRKSQRGPKDIYGVRSKEAKKAGNHPAVHVGIDDYEHEIGEAMMMFQSLVEEIRYSVVEGSGSRGSKSGRQDANFDRNADRGRMARAGDDGFGSGPSLAGMHAGRSAGKAKKHGGDSDKAHDKSLFRATARNDRRRDDHMGGRESGQALDRARTRKAWVQDSAHREKETKHDNATGLKKLISRKPKKPKSSDSVSKGDIKKHGKYPSFHHLSPGK